VRNAIRAVAIATALLLLVLGAVGSVRWAKRGGTSARVMASALILALGMGIVIKPPQQGIEQARENPDKTGGESGDPPAHRGESSDDARSSAEPGG
jgi:hypothetical protein